MKRLLVKFYHKVGGEFELLGTTEMFNTGKVNLVAKAFMHAPNQCRGATRVTFEEFVKR